MKYDIFRQKLRQLATKRFSKGFLFENLLVLDLSLVHDPSRFPKGGRAAADRVQQWSSV